MTEPYKQKVERAKAADHTKRVVSQPTQQSDVKAVVDKTSPTGIREKK